MINIVTVLRIPKKSSNPLKPEKQYSIKDVLKLKLAFEKFLKIDHKFFCLTDHPPVDNLKTISLIGDTPSWWAKIELFRPTLFEGPTFYIDLDMIVCDDLNDFVESILDEKFLMLKDPKGNGATSSIMFWNGNFSNLWNIYCKDKENIWEMYRGKPRIGDQFFIQENIDFKFFSDITTINPNWFHFIKPHKEIHKESKILIFEGKSNKPWSAEYTDNFYVNEHWRNIDV
jgi:hypothetical protein